MVSAVILTKNEEENITECIKSLSFCDEVIVIDDNSSDKTVLLAKNLKAKVFSKALDNNFSQQRNFGLSKAKSEWILFIDADERPSLGLVGEINHIVHTPMIELNGFFARRKDHMWGKTLRFGETADGLFLRLAKKNTGIWKGNVHETWEISGRKGFLKNPIEHYPHQKLTSFLKEINFYSTLRAQQLYEEKRTVSSFSIIAYPVGKFIKNYIFKLGFMDGTAGFITAVVMSMHSFLVRGKLWALSKK